jgi:heme-degrading monooxygenase HmoA
MMTVITRVQLKPGSEPEWDAAVRERLEMAKTRTGWIGGQLLIPLEGMNERIIIGTWSTRADWEAWHEDPGFKQTRERLDGLQESSGETSWHEVVSDVRREAPAG